MPHRIPFWLLVLLVAACFVSVGCSTTDGWPLRAPQSVAWNVDPTIPTAARAPAGHILLGHVIGKGVQIYTCQADTSGGHAWVHSGAEADLIDEDGNVIGRHYAGPTWEFNHGGKVTAQRLVAVPQTKAPPWLLLGATDNSGSGTLGRTRYIQRVHTAGGLPPAICNASDTGKEIRVAYTADYYFYGPLAAPTRIDRD